MKNFFSELRKWNKWGLLATVTICFVVYGMLNHNPALMANSMTFATVMGICFLVFEI